MGVHNNLRVWVEHNPVTLSDNLAPPTNDNNINTELSNYVLINQPCLQIDFQTLRMHKMLVYDVWMSVNVSVYI